MMRHQVVWAACSVTNPANDEEKILVKGDLLPDWVSEFTQFVLTTSGAVKVVDEPDRSLVPEEELPPQVSLPEHPPANTGQANRPGKAKP